MKSSTFGRALLWSSLVAQGSLSTPASPQEAREREALEVSFLERSVGLEESEVVTLDYGVEAYAELSERHVRGEPFTLVLPFPGGEDVRAMLWPVTCLAPGARARIVSAGDETTWVEPRARCFAGALEDGGTAFLGCAPGQIQGYLYAGGALHFLSGGDSRGGIARLARARQASGPPALVCETIDAPGTDEPASDVAELLGPRTVLRIADVFIEAEDGLTRLFASNEECLDYVVILLTAVSEICRRDLGLALRIPDGYLRLWKTPVPWSPILDVTSIARWWRGASNTERDLPRAAVHVLKAGPSRGQGYVNGTCDRATGYAKSALVGSFPYPLRHTDPGNIDPFVVAHEFGHVFGSVHSQNYHPPIRCDDGSGPDRGTLMSYCPLTLGIENVGLRYHEREQQQIRGKLRPKTCLKRVPLLPGDYDGDGVRSRGDLMVADRTLAQGFRSFGAEEALDLDRDGDFDRTDRDILAQFVAGYSPAQATVRNGSGRNAACLTSLTPPVLGTSWSASITTATAAAMTVIAVSDQPLAGRPTWIGELLIRPPPSGGRWLDLSFAPAAHGLALHEIPLPLDLALSQRTVYAQGFVVAGPRTGSACNALDLLLSPFAK